MRFCAQLLKQRISHLPHLFRDSSDFLQKLNKCRFDSDTKVYRFDIKDFFMSGAHSTIINSCASEIHENIRDPFRLLLGAILSSQYVKLPEALRVMETRSKPTHFRVKKGTGMGMLVSGEASDIAFYSLAERTWALLPRVRRKHKVRFYGRFKDDGLIIFCGSSRSERLEFFEGLNMRASEFRIARAVHVLVRRRLWAALAHATTFGRWHPRSFGPPIAMPPYTSLCGPEGTRPILAVLCRGLCFVVG